MTLFQLPIYQPQVNFRQFSLFEYLNSAVSFSPTIIWLTAGFLVVIFVVLSFILSYHWIRFGFETLVMAKARLAYYSVSVSLLVVMAISLAVYLSSL